MKKFGYSLLALELGALALPSVAAAGTGTLDHLQTAFNGESNVHTRNLAFAEKADQEQYNVCCSRGQRPSLRPVDHPFSS